MTLVMIVSACAPTLSVFATAAHDHNETEAKTELNYVSLGDSMSNGIGLEDGYDATMNNGYTEVSVSSYPSQFASWLAGVDHSTVKPGQTKYEGTKGTVNLTQLATSSVRVEDLYYILTVGTDKEVTPDGWTLYDLLYQYHRWGSLEGENRVPGEKHYEENAKVAETYQTAVKEADVITLAVGNGNFGVYLVKGILDLVGIGGEFDMHDIRFAHCTMKNALELCQANEEVTKLVNDTYAYALEQFEAMGLPMDLVTKFAEYSAYTTASFVIHYMKTVDLIVEMNPDVTLVIVPLINNIEGFIFEVELNDTKTTVDLGQYVGALYTTLNSFLAAYPAGKQWAGEYKDATVLYAELAGQVEIFAQSFTKLYGELPENVTKETYPEGRAFCHNRFFSNIQDFVMPILLGGTSADYYWVFTDADIIEYEIAKATSVAAFVNYVANNSKKAELISYYLGIVDAMFASINEKATIDADALTVDTTEGFSLFSLLGDTIGEIEASIYADVENKLADGVLVTEIYGMVGGDLTTAQNIAGLYVTPETISENLTSVGMLQVLLALYARMNLAWGLASHPTAEGHKTLFESVVNAYETKHTVQDETLENLEDVAKFIEENYDEAYAFGYNYLDENGYIDTAVSALNSAIAAVNSAIVEVENYNGLTDGLKADLLAELEATANTLEELRNVLRDDSAKDVEGLVAAVLALGDDLNTHLNNIGAILEQAGVDYVLPALDFAISYINGTVIPYINNTVETFTNAVVDYINAKLDAVHTGLVGLSNAVRNQIVTLLVKIQLHVQGKIENALLPIVIAVTKITNAVNAVVGSVENAFAIAMKVVDTVLYINDKVDGAITNSIAAILNAQAKLVATLIKAEGDINNAIATAEKVLNTVVENLDKAVENVENVVEKSLKAIDTIVNTVVGYYETVEEAVDVAIDVFKNVVDYINATHGNIVKEIEKAVDLFVTIVDTLSNTVSNLDNIIVIAAQIHKNLLSLDFTVTEDMLNNALNANYQVTDNSMYVSLGNASYAEDLAEMLGLGNKHYSFALTADYAEKVAQADLITIKLDNGEIGDFVMAQLTNPGSSSLDWNKYLDAEGQAALAEVLAAVEADIIATGVIEELVGGLGLDSAMLVGTAVDVLECTLYAYAQFVSRVVTTVADVRAINPDAVVVITTIDNPLTTLGVDLSNLGSDAAPYLAVLDYYVDAMNAHLFVAALTNENTIFVDSNDAADIYAALNVTNVHVHVYSDECVDTTCDICGAVRVAPGHTFTNYVYNNDAKCGVDGTKTATCDVCHTAKDTVKAEGTALSHVWTDADCKTPKTCELCGAKDGAALGHNYVDGACTRCGLVDPNYVEDRDTGLTTEVIIGITVGSIAVVAGAGAAVYFFIFKKKNA